jgi:hypothetical protein
MHVGKALTVPVDTIVQSSLSAGVFRPVRASASISLAIADSPSASSGSG